jgi:hypothetical protein
MIYTGLKTDGCTECFFTGSPWGNSSPGVDEERKAVHQKVEKKNNVLPLWGNERTMNLNPMILTNIQSSHYFKGVYQVIDTYYFLYKSTLSECYQCSVMCFFFFVIIFQLVK